MVLPLSFPVGTAVQAIKQLVTPRKEKINDDDWFIYNKRQGYIKSGEGKLYPNIGEVERRRGLYMEAANEQSERQLIRELYKRATGK